MCFSGQPVKTWSMLASTVTPGSDVIKVWEDVTWKAGDEIVIASTGGHLSQKENEKRTIKSVAQDKRTLTLTEKLKYKHLGVTENYKDGTEIQVRAEVGLLTRNVLVRGSNNVQWNDKIEACPEGFNPGTLRKRHYCRNVCILEGVLDKFRCPKFIKI